MHYDYHPELKPNNSENGSFSGDLICNRRNSPENVPLLTAES